MDERIRAHVAKYNESKGRGMNDDDIIEMIRYFNHVLRETYSQHRWWDQYKYVVNIDGMFIEYIHAEANRDESVYELGYEFDPSSIREVVPVETVVITYVPKDGDK